jgi:VCBS repeat-containing protein
VASRSIRTSIGVAAAAILTACGGGGGGSSSGGGGGTPSNTAPTFLVTTFAATEEVDLASTVTATDANGDALTFASTSNPAHGSLTFAANGSFSYRPATNFSGADSFGVSANDGRGGVTNATVTVNVAGVNDVPQAADDRIQLAYAATLSVPVLANDVDADGDALTITLLEQPLAGLATVAGNNVSITGLPAAFRGLLRFRYQIRDAAATTSSAYAVVFVDTAPFRAVLPVVSSGRVGVGISNFIGEPRLLTGADPAATVIDSFLASSDGAFVAYHRFDPALTTNRDQLCTVSTVAGSAAGCYQIPDSLQLHQLPPNNDHYVYEVSPNGRWVAVVLTRADLAVVPSLYLIDTTNPTVATQVTMPAGAPHAVLPTFSSNSGFLYFIASDDLSTTGLDVYRMQPGSAAAPVRMSSPPIASRVDGLTLSRDGSRLVFQRLGIDPGVFLVATNAPGVEHRLSQPIDLAIDNLQSAIGYPVPADPDLTAVAYVVWRNNGPRYLWHAPVVTGGPMAEVIGWIDPGMVVTQWPLMRPDGRAMLVAFGPSFTSLSVREFSLDWTGGHVVANGIVGSYDAFGGDLIHVMNLVPNGFNFAGQGLIATRNGSAAPVPIGTPGMQPLTSSDVRNSTGTFVLGETEIGPSSGVYFRLANLSAPAMLLPLSATPIPARTTQGALRAAIVGGE